MKRNYVFAIVVLAAIVVPLVWAVTTTTQVNFNVAAVVGYTLTLPGESATTATDPTAAPTAAIEFNVSSGSGSFIDPRVVGTTGASGLQNDSIPIFEFDNTGTVNINITTTREAGLDACITLFGANNATNLSDHVVITNGANASIAENFGPADAAVEWYMFSNFTSCTTAATNSLNVTTRAEQS